MAEKLNVDTIKRISELTTVKKISDLQTIPIIENVNGTYVTTQQYNNSYLLSSTYFPDNTSYGRYINYKVKISDVTYYLSTLGSEDLNSFKATFNNFINNLCENTKNSYVQLVKNQDATDDYSYTFKYQLSSIMPESHSPFSYNDGENSTYAYTNKLTDGIVTNYVLEEYIRETLGRILGVPSTPAYISEAIDSVIEFVDWFKGYTKDKDGLNELLTKIDNKDNEIIASYTNADQDIIDSYTAADTEIINKINNINIKPKAGTNISIGEDNSVNCDIGLDSTNNKSFTIGNSKYSLNFVGGQFYISEVNNPYVQITLTLNSPSSATLPPIEYGDENALTTINLSATPSKDCTIISGTSSNWATVSSTTQSAGTAIKANNVPCSTTSNFSASLKVKEILTQDEIDYGGNTAKTADITVKRNIIYDSWRYFNVTALDLTNGLTSTDFANFSKLNNKNSNGYSSQYIFTDSEMSGGKYVYILIKKSSGTFILGSETTPGQFPGGVTNTEKTYKPYGSSGPTYYLYRVTERQSGAFNITVS